MRLLSSILQRVVYPALGKVGYFPSQASACVVTYHGVLPDSYRSTDSFLDNTLVTVEQFRAQLKLLKRRYSVISPQRFLAWIEGHEELPERCVLLTCDDGLLNNASVMLPVLLEEELQCLFFVTGQSTEDIASVLWYVDLYLMLMNAPSSERETDICGVRVATIGNDSSGRRSEWIRLTKCLSSLGIDGRVSFLREAAARWGLRSDWRKRYLEDLSLRQRFQLLGPGEMKELSANGMTIGAHTISHPVLSELTDRQAWAEIHDCRQKLEQCTKHSVWALAYPFGNDASVGVREFKIAEDAGYECAFMNLSGPLSVEKRYSLPRVHVTAEMTLDVYEAHISGFHEHLRRKAGSLNWSNGAGDSR